MAVIQMMLILFPGALSMYLYKRTTKQKLSLLDGICMYCTLTLLIFFLGNLVLTLWGRADFAWDHFSAQWITKYILLSGVLSVMSAMLIIFTSGFKKP